MKQVKPAPFSYKLDPYEQELEDYFEHLSAAGLFVKGTLTPERRKELEQTAANTIEMRRLGRRDLIEYSEEPTPAAVKSSTAVPLHPWKKTPSESASPALRKPALVVS